MRYRVSSCLRPLHGVHFQGQKSGWRGYLQTRMYSSAGYSPRPCVVVVVPAQSRPVPVGGRGRGFEPGNWTPPPPHFSHLGRLSSRSHACVHAYTLTYTPPYNPVLQSSALPPFHCSRKCSSLTLLNAILAAGNIMTGGGGSAYLVLLY